MTKRVKTVTLFNKNHITVTRKDFVHFDTSAANITSSTFYTKNLEWGGDQYGREVKKRSPLGFYYISREKPNLIRPTGNMTTVRICLREHEYEITYPTTFEGVAIGTDARPWEIYPGEKAMADHFVRDLMTTLNKIYALAEDEKVDMTDIRNKSFTELFGNVNGPRYQTDEEKILSHGFDLKESFRKGKEK